VCRAVFVLALLSLSAAAHAAEGETPWVRLVPPDRMCLRFGEYDWLKYIREIDTMAKGRHTAVARAREKALGEALWYLGRGTGRICSCGSKEAVLADLRRMLPELKKRPRIAHQDMAAADHVGGTIAGIEADGIAVVSAEHEGCKH
jgi:hypothetical protein